MSDTPRTEFVAHESGDPEWNRFPNRFGRMMAHASILERELSAKEKECSELRSQLDAVLKRTSLSFKYPGGEKP